MPKMNFSNYKSWCELCCVIRELASISYQSSHRLFPSPCCSSALEPTAEEKGNGLSKKIYSRKNDGSVSQGKRKEKEGIRNK